MEQKIVWAKCPICKRAPIVWQDEIDGPGGPIPTDYTLWCSKCHITILSDTRKKLEKKWNKLVRK